MGSVSARTGIANGQFDQDLIGWQVNASPSVNVSAVWASGDASGDPASGSAELRDLAPGNGGAQVILSQCVDLTDAEFPMPWQVSAQVQVEGEPWVRAWLLLEQHFDTQCSDFTGLTGQEIANFSDPTWQSISGNFSPQVQGTGSVLIQLAIEKPDGSGGGGLARFDGVVFGATRDELFSDRFQSPP
jgi:hypothetical protein